MKFSGSRGNFFLLRYKSNVNTALCQIEKEKIFMLEGVGSIEDGKDIIFVAGCFCYKK